MCSLTPWRGRRLAVVLAVLVLAGCSAAASPAIPSAAAPGTPAAATAPLTPAPTATTAAPAASTAAPSAVASTATPAADCPAKGSVITVAGLLALPVGCTWADYRVRGWWDAPRQADGIPAGTFDAVLRGELPKFRPPDSTAPTPVLPIDANALKQPYTGYAGLLVEAVVAKVAVEREGRCAWVFGPGGSTNPATPVWTCPTYGEVVKAKAVTPTKTDLRNCPSTSRVLPVAVFTQYPRACFGSRSVRLSGWLDTWYLIGGWESSWVIRPDWLWSMQIGPLPYLSPSSYALAEGSLELHVRPGSIVDTTRQNRWVVLTGHYATTAEAATCKVVTLPGGQTGDRPTAAQARQDCARAFVATGVRVGQPGG